MPSTNEMLAKLHFEKYQHEGPLIASYRISDLDYLVMCRPDSGSSRCIYSTVDLNSVNAKVIEYVNSLMTNWTMDNMLIRDLEVFDGEVI
jgi:hypothetical protein